LSIVLEFIVFNYDNDSIYITLKCFHEKKFCKMFCWDIYIEYKNVKWEYNEFQNNAQNLYKYTINIQCYVHPEW
jgi:hypothetical protein